MYLENDDLCKRIKDQINEDVFYSKDLRINHLGGKGSFAMKNIKMQIELSRNWHWMWSKFYFNKKHYGFLKAFLETTKIYFKILIKNDLFYL